MGQKGKQKNSIHLDDDNQRKIMGRLPKVREYKTMNPIPATSEYTTGDSKPKRSSTTFLSRKPTFNLCSKGSKSDKQLQLATSEIDSGYSSVNKNMVYPCAKLLKVHESMKMENPIITERRKRYEKLLDAVSRSECGKNLSRNDRLHEMLEGQSTGTRYSQEDLAELPLPYMFKFDRGDFYLPPIDDGKNKKEKVLIHDIPKINRDLQVYSLESNTPQINIPDMTIFNQRYKMQLKDRPRDFFFDDKKEGKKERIPKKDRVVTYNNYLYSDKIPRNIMTIMTKKPPTLKPKNDPAQFLTYRYISKKLNFPRDIFQEYPLHSVYQYSSRYTPDLGKEFIENIRDHLAIKSRTTLIEDAANARLLNHLSHFKMKRQDKLNRDYWDMQYNYCGHRKLSPQAKYTFEHNVHRDIPERMLRRRNLIRGHRYSTSLEERMVAYIYRLTRLIHIDHCRNTIARKYKTYSALGRPTEKSEMKDIVIHNKYFTYKKKDGERYNKHRLFNENRNIVYHAYKGLNNHMQENCNYEKFDMSLVLFNRRGNKEPTCTEKAREYDDKRCLLLKESNRGRKKKFKTSIPVQPTARSTAANNVSKPFDDKHISDLLGKDGNFDKDMSKLEKIRSNTERRFKLTQFETIEDNLNLMKKLKREFKSRKVERTNIVEANKKRWAKEATVVKSTFKPLFEHPRKDSNTQDYNVDHNGDFDEYPDRHRDIRFSNSNMYMSLSIGTGGLLSFAADTVRSAMAGSSQAASYLRNRVIGETTSLPIAEDIVSNLVSKADNLDAKAIANSPSSQLSAFESVNIGELQKKETPSKDCYRDDKTQRGNQTGQSNSSYDQRSTRQRERTAFLKYPLRDSAKVPVLKGRDIIGAREVPENCMVYVKPKPIMKTTVVPDLSINDKIISTGHIIPVESSNLGRFISEYDEMRTIERVKSMCELDIELPEQGVNNLNLKERRKSESALDLSYSTGLPHDCSMGRIQAILKQDERYGVDNKKNADKKPGKDAQDGILRRSKTSRSLIRATNQREPLNDNSISTTNSFFNSLSIFGRSYNFINPNTSPTIASEPGTPPELINLPIFESIRTTPIMHSTPQCMPNSPATKSRMPSAFDVPNPYQQTRRSPPSPQFPSRFFMNKVDSHLRGVNRLPDINNTSPSRSAYPLKSQELHFTPRTPVKLVKDVRQAPGSSFEPIIPSDHYNRRTNLRSGFAGRSRGSRVWKDSSGTNATPSNSPHQRPMQSPQQDMQFWQYDSPLRRLEMQAAKEQASATTSPTPPTSPQQSPPMSRPTSPEQTKIVISETVELTKKKEVDDDDDILSHLTASDIKNLEDTLINDPVIHSSKPVIKLKRSTESKIVDKPKNISKKRN